ncbi:hypothetical protein RRF57_006780 [Xylaria bambusicola]|uniref:Uncharacterized protein n=1 Tax=Xylaria bambusicola TaxID=326684 RepID=A0AAN7UEY7_9PEZI
MLRMRGRAEQGVGGRVCGSLPSFGAWKLCKRITGRCDDSTVERKWFFGVGADDVGGCGWLWLVSNGHCRPKVLLQREESHCPRFATGSLSFSPLFTAPDLPKEVNGL